MKYTVGLIKMLFYWNISLENFFLFRTMLLNNVFFEKVLINPAKNFFTIYLVHRLKVAYFYLKKVYLNKY